MYSYILEATGVADHLVASAEKSEALVDQGEDVIGNINTVISSLESLDIEELQDSAGALYDQASGFMETAKNNPQEILQGLLNYGIQGLSSCGAGGVCPTVGGMVSNERRPERRRVSAGRAMSSEAWTVWISIRRTA